MSTDVAPSASKLSPYVAGELRAHLGRYSISRSELARRLDVDNTWVGKRLAGQTAITLDDLDDIAAALGVPVEVFLPPSRLRASSPTQTAQPQRKAPDQVQPRVVAVAGEARIRRSQPPRARASAPARETRISRSPNRPVTPLAG